MELGHIHGHVSVVVARSIRIHSHTYSNTKNRCAICRNKLTEPSIEYQASPATANEAGLSIAWGNCGHVYHLDCIQQWLKTRHTCPICGKEWDYAKIERILDGKGDEASTEAAK